MTSLAFSLVRINEKGDLKKQGSDGNPFNWIKLGAIEKETKEFLRERYIPTCGALGTEYVMSVSSGHWRTLEWMDDALTSLSESQVQATELGLAISAFENATGMTKLSFCFFFSLFT